MKKEPSPAKRVALPRINIPLQASLRRRLNACAKRNGMMSRGVVVAAISAWVKADEEKKCS
jgi:hypothetical protein